MIFVKPWAKKPTGLDIVASAMDICCNKPLGSNDYFFEPRFITGRLRMTDWKMIVDQHGGIVWRTIFRLVGNHADAADCFQETFLEAVRVARREPVRDWPAILRHLATLRALDSLRDRYRLRNRLDPAADIDGVASREAGPEQMAEAGELTERLRIALAKLPQQQAEIFCLSCLDNLAYREIGERLGVTSNAVGVLLHRARRRLQELLVPVDAGPACDDRGSNR